MSAVEIMTPRARPWEALGERSWRLLQAGVHYPEAGWLTVLLAFATGFVVAWSVEAARWVPELPGYFVATVSGGALGLLVAQTRRVLLLPHLGALALGLGQAVVQTVVLVPGGSWEGRLLTTGYRVVLWAQALLEGGASTDRLPFVLILIFAGWLLTYATVFLALRTRSIWALLPAGFILLSNLTYLPPSALSWLLLYLLMAGLLLVRFVHLERAARWGTIGPTPGLPVAVHAIHAGLWFALAVFLATSFLPELGAGPPPLRRAWAQMRAPLGQMEGTFTRVFASLPARRALSLYSFGGELPFRGNVALSDDIVMLVESDRPLYWRARTYDDYRSWGWRNGRLRTEDRGTLQDLAGDVPLPCAECVRGFTVDVRSPTTTIYTAGLPLRTSLPLDAHYLSAPGPEGERVVKLESERVLQPHQRYTVQVYVPQVSGELLRRQGDSYPDWATERFLELPEDLSPRLRTLALRLTAGSKTPFEKVIRIRDFLRTYPYSQQIEAPPPGQDAVAYFLFTQKVGYSDYFGSAMVVLARAAGVPARLAVGYLSGEYDAEAGVYTVRESDAHAWPEIYFPNVGWVPFEPTASRPVLIRGGPLGEFPVLPLGLATEATGDLTGFYWESPDLLGLDLGGGDEDLDALLADQGVGLGGRVNLGMIRSLAVGLGGVGLVFFLAGGLLLWRRGLAQPRTPAQAYSQMVRLGRLAGIGLHGGETPAEYASRLARAAPRAAPGLRGIADAYGRALYGPKDALGTAGLVEALSWGAVARRLLGLVIRHIMLRPGRRLAYEG